MILADEKIRFDDNNKRKITKVGTVVAMFLITLKSYQTFSKTDFCHVKYSILIFTF